jgi:hypothetical protein
MNAPTHFTDAAATNASTARINNSTDLGVSSTSTGSGNTSSKSTKGKSGVRGSWAIAGMAAGTVALTLSMVGILLARRRNKVQRSISSGDASASDMEGSL